MVIIKNILIFVIIIALIFLIFLLCFRDNIYNEHFAQDQGSLLGIYNCNKYGICNSKIDGVNDDLANLSDEYMRVDKKSWFNTYNRYNHVVRQKELDANRYNTRQPGLIKQQYSYSDGIINQNTSNFTKEGKQFGYYYDLPDVANLKELGIDYKNKLGAVMDKDIARTSLEYWPDVSKPICPNVNKPYCPNANKYNKQKICSDGVYSGARRRTFSTLVDGYNPGDNLPGLTAQLSDRDGVMSNEAKLAFGIMKEKRDELDYLPMDNIAYAIEPH